MRFLWLVVMGCFLSVPLWACFCRGAADTPQVAVSSQQQDKEVETKKSLVRSSFEKSISVPASCLPQGHSSISLSGLEASRYKVIAREYFSAREQGLFLESESNNEADIFLLRLLKNHGMPFQDSLAVIRSMLSVVVTH